MGREIVVGDVIFGGNRPLVLIAGPCVIEEEALTLRIAEFLKRLTEELGIGLVFKASYDKANRTSITSYRGVRGWPKGCGFSAGSRPNSACRWSPTCTISLRWPRPPRFSTSCRFPPFFAGRPTCWSRRPRRERSVNVKKGQFLAPWDMGNAVGKLEAAGNRQILLTERGASFGYNNLVVDMRSLVIMRETGCPVIFDATHAVQLPGGAGTASAGQRQYVGALSRAAAAVGIDGLFWEVHEDPERALCDGPNSLFLRDLKGMLNEVLAIDAMAKGSEK